MKEMPLSLKIERFQRQKLMQGLKPKRDAVQKESLLYLQSLKFIQKFEEDTTELTRTLRNRDYDSYRADPIGHKLIEQRELEKKLAAIDPYVTRLKFIEGESAYLNKLNQDLNQVQPESVPEEAEEQHEDPDDEVVPHLASRKLQGLQADINISHVHLEKEKRLNKLRGMGYVSNLERREELYPKAYEEQAELPLKSPPTEIGDVCRIPSAYLSKTRVERLQDSCDVLAKMQSLTAVHAQRDVEI